MNNSKKSIVRILIGHKNGSADYRLVDGARYATLDDLQLRLKPSDEN